MNLRSYGKNQPLYSRGHTIKIGRESQTDKLRELTQHGRSLKDSITFLETINWRLSQKAYRSPKTYKASHVGNYNRGKSEDHYETYEESLLTMRLQITKQLREIWDSDFIKIKRN